MNQINEVPIPSDSLIWSELAHLDYQDCYEMIVPINPLPVDDAVRAFFYGAPGWVRQAMAARDRVMGTLGYQTQQGEERATLDGIVFTPGMQFGLFHILKRSTTEVIMGTDDTHLNFRVSVYVKALDSQSAVSIATTVQIHNKMGRIYFALVKQPHRLVVRSMMRNIREALLKRNPQSPTHQLTP